MSLIGIRIHMVIRKYGYVEWLIGIGRRPKTVSQYALHLDNLTALYDKFNQKNVDEFVALYKGNVIRSFIKSYIKYLLRNPESLVPKINEWELGRIRAIQIEAKASGPRKTPKVITQEEAELICSKIPDKKFKLMFRLSFYCGLRREEMLTLQVSMFDINKWEQNMEGMGLLTILRKRGKEGMIPALNKVMHWVYDYLDDDFEPEDFLFPGMNTEAQIKKWVRVLSKASKEAIGRHINPHLLRHSIAMHLRGKGFAIDEIKEFLGHESISTTQLYSRVTSQQLMERFEDY